MIKLLICLALQNCWEVKHFDFQNAFSNGKLNRPVYVELPKQLFANLKTSAVVIKLHCSLYGLKDASKIWLELIRDKFRAAEMEKSIVRHVLFKGTA